MALLLQRQGLLVWPVAGGLQLVVDIAILAQPALLEVAQCQQSFAGDRAERATFQAGAAHQLLYGTVKFIGACREPGHELLTG
ncbi:hypothetical protein D9M71_794940 [compost metagenome]